MKAGAERSRLDHNRDLALPGESGEAKSAVYSERELSRGWTPKMEKGLVPVS